MRDREADDMNNDELNVLNVKELMNYLGIGRDKAYALMKTPSFPSVQIGKTYIVSVIKLEKWLEDSINRKIIL